ncbi:hypothetical protein BD626DRAFT_622179 [Schizophyllum amplum]|uniref:Uncharacterized protein n=1 Tax=Schizophyllum amplum TaxID=97359 RepID=A0A550BTH2_9AGAR|nr:hypothetical protein BD626DRAFT_622179 [Auriculariopsis ampla]
MGIKMRDFARHRHRWPNTWSHQRRSVADPTFALTRPIRDEEWRGLLRYTRYIKTLRINFKDGSDDNQAPELDNVALNQKVVFNAYRQKSAHSTSSVAPAPVTAPRLKLWFCGHSGQMCNITKRVIVDCILTLSARGAFELTELFLADEPIDALVDDSDSSDSDDYDEGEGDEYGDDGAFSDALRACHQLRRLKTCVLGPVSLVGISELPRLGELALSTHGIAIFLADYAPKASEFRATAFRSVRSLQFYDDSESSISFAYLTDLISVRSSRWRLETFHCDTVIDVVVEELEEHVSMVPKLISDHVHMDTLKSLRLTLASLELKPSDVPFDAVLLRLLEFSRLEELVVRNGDETGALLHPTPLTTDQVRTIALSFRGIRKLGLGLSAPLSALSAFAEHCPRLSHLQIRPDRDNGLLPGSSAASLAPHHHIIGCSFYMARSQYETLFMGTHPTHAAAQAIMRRTFPRAVFEHESEMLLDSD